MKINSVFFPPFPFLGSQELYYHLPPFMPENANISNLIPTRKDYTFYQIICKVPFQIKEKEMAAGHINSLLQFAKCLVTATHYTVNSIHADDVEIRAISDSGFKRR